MCASNIPYAHCTLYSKLWPSQAFSQSELGPLARKRVFPPSGPQGEDKLACGLRGEGTQFRRRGEHYGILCIL
jgi:hypothetical protein